MRNFWNHGSTIPVGSLTTKERKRAIRAWAEGNLSLKRLLERCYDEGVETTGCHSGHSRTSPYFDIRPANTPKVQALISETLLLEKAQVFVMFFGNPWSGPDWHKTNIGLSPLHHKYTREFFKKLNKAVTEGNVYDEGIEKFLMLCDFLDDKEAAIIFRIIVEPCEKYTIYAQCQGTKEDLEYYAKIFGDFMTNDTDSQSLAFCESWKIEACGKDAFTAIMIKLYERVTENWTRELPMKATSDMPLHAKAMLMRRKFGTDREGIEKMNAWLNENREPYMSEVNY